MRGKGDESVKQEGAPQEVSFISYLVVDEHLPATPLENFPEPGGAIMGEAQSLKVPDRLDLVKLWIKCGPWQVTCFWPMNWFLTKGAPGLNKYGYLPTAEFGTPTYSGEDQGPKYPQSAVIPPFSYKNIKGEVVTPATPAGPKGA